jgi:hypothetical protein
MRTAMLMRLDRRGLLPSMRALLSVYYTQYDTLLYRYPLLSIATSQGF